MYTITATSKGQIVIPAEIRKKLHIKKGTKLFINEDGRQITIRPCTPEYIDSLVGVFGKDGGAVDFLLNERAADRLAEEKRYKKWAK
jgi:AbrB family looped-hinge helix DNA binding protein